MVGIFKQDWGQTSKVEFRKPIRGVTLRSPMKRGCQVKNNSSTKKKGSSRIIVGKEPIKITNGTE